MMVTATVKRPLNGVLKRVFPLAMLGFLALAPGCSLEGLTGSLDDAAAFFGGYGNSDALNEPRQPLTRQDIYTPTIQQMSRGEAKSAYRELLLRYAREYLNTDYSSGSYVGAKQSSDGKAVMFLWHTAGLGYSAIVTDFAGESGIVAATEPGSGRAFAIVKDMRLCFTFHYLDQEPAFGDDGWEIEFPSKSSTGLLGEGPVQGHCTQGYDKAWLSDFSSSTVFTVLSRAYGELGYTHSDSILKFRSRLEMDRFLSVLVAAFPGVHVS